MASPASRTSPYVVYATLAGGVPDANLDTGVAVTDSSAALNAVLARASASNPVMLVLDGAFGANLDVKNGYCTIQGLGRGTGLVNPKPATAEIIANSNASRYSQSGSTAVLVNRVALRDFRINGGRTTSGGAVYYHSNIHLENVADVEVSGVRTEQPDAWNLALIACQNVIVSRCQFYGTQSPNPVGTGSNQDGIHVGAATKHVAVSDCYFKTNDDAIALNWNEGYPNAPVGSGAPGGDVTISNCNFDNVLCAVRDLAGGVTSDRIVMSNCTGTTQMCVWKAGVEGDEADNGTQRNYSISNCSFAVTGPSAFGYINLCGLAANLQVSNFTMLSPTQGIPFVTTSGSYTQYDRAHLISVDGLTIHYDANGSAADYIWDGKVPVDRLSISNFRQVADANISAPSGPSAFITLGSSYGATGVYLKDWEVRYGGDLVAITGGAGVSDVVAITGLDAYGLTGYALHLAGGTVPRTAIVEGRWGNSSHAPVYIASGLTLANLGTIGLYSASGTTPYTGGGSVGNNITKSGGTYGNP